VKKILLSSVVVLAFATVGHADEISELKVQAKQLREQMKRLADLEKRERALEARKAAAPAKNPVDALAADLPYKAVVKTKVPESDGLCWHGVCLYGTFDGGAVFEQHGAPFNAFAQGGVAGLISKNSNGSYFGVGTSMLSTSFIALKGKYEIAEDLYAVFDLRTSLNVATGMSSSGIGSIAQDNGTPASAANSFGDSPKAGQMFNSAAYFGVNSPVYGTFTMGRQSALSSDNVIKYDALAGSNSWSVLTYLGPDGGGGNTENRTFDNSFKYQVNVGLVRFAAETQLRNGGNSSTGNAFQGDVGFDYMDLSMDFAGGKIYDSVSANTLTAAQVTAMNASGINVGLGGLAGTISDNIFFQIGARYTIGQWKIFGGYENITYANPNNPLTPGAFLEGGYTIFAPNNTNYTTDKNLQTLWGGVRYAIAPTVDIAGAYYHEWQNSFINGPAATSTNPKGTCTTAISPGCSGQLDAVSLVVDWRFAAHMDAYAGVMWSQVANGLASGYLALPPGGNKASSYDPGIGLRYDF
jgi:predicted porin